MQEQDNIEHDNLEEQNNQEAQNNSNIEQAPDPPIGESSKEAKITPDTIMNMENEKTEFEKEHNNLHSAAFQLAAQIVMKVFQPSTLCGKIVCKKLYYKAR